MTVEIITKHLQLNLYGFSGIAVNKEYSKTAFTLMDKMWQIVKSENLQNKGINIWVYEPNEKVFAGVELENIPKYDTGLEQKIVNLTKYAYHKHIGSYSQLKQAGLNMKNELRARGFETNFPYIEMYGHWKNDETKLETELLMCLKLN